MNMVKVIVVIAVSLAIVYVAQQYFGHVTLPGRARLSGDNLVVTEKAALKHFADSIEAIGTAQANENVTVTSTVTERVAEVKFESGDMAKKDQLLVRLEDSEERADVNEAKVNLDEKKRELERLKNLREKKLIAEQEFDTQKSAVDTAEAQFMAAEARLRDRSIMAPFAGVLGLRQVSPGALVSPGSAIVTLDDLSVIKAEFTIPETFLADLAAGQRIEAGCAAWPGEVFAGTVSSIDNRVDASTRAVTVQAKITNADRRLRAGMLLTVELISHPRDAVGVPEKALIAFADKQYVFVLKDGLEVEKREVKLGRRDAGWVEIISGLAAGEIIVIEGALNLQNGSKVTLAKTATNPAAPAASKSEKME